MSLLMGENGHNVQRCYSYGELLFPLWTCSRVVVELVSFYDMLIKLSAISVLYFYSKLLEITAAKRLISWKNVSIWSSSYTCKYM